MVVALLTAYISIRANQTEPFRLPPPTRREPTATGRRLSTPKAETSLVRRAA